MEHPLAAQFMCCNKLTNYCKLGVSLPHNSGGQKSESKCKQVWFLPEALKESLFLAFLLVSGGHQPSLACCSNVRLHLQLTFSMCLSVSSHSLLIMMPVIGFRAHPNPARLGLHLNNFITAARRTLFPNKVASQVLVFRTSTLLWGAYSSSYHTPYTESAP